MQNRYMRENKKNCNDCRERGNVVTLVLLGLAVAILAGVIVLYFYGNRNTVPLTPLDGNNGAGTSTDEVTQADPRADWSTYENSEFNFTIKYPPGWVVNEGTIGLEPAITIHPDLGTTSDLVAPWDHHTEATHLSIYPQGIPTEGIMGDERPSDIIVTAPRAVARDYILENGRPWATMVRFEAPPAGWNSSGFVLARALIEDEETICLRAGEPVPEGDCQPLTGDEIARSGYVDPALRETQKLMLTSFGFETSADPLNETTSAQTRPIDDLIRVTSPVADSTVTSPLVIEGEARGTWFFEASFPVELRTSSGEVLVRAPATATDDWMTEDFVPFTVSLAFPEPQTATGTLLLERSNPSGLESQARSVSIPVRFSE